MPAASWWNQKNSMVLPTSASTETRMQQPGAYALADRQVDVETPEHVSVGYELADLGSRFTAMLIDGLVLSLIFIGMLALLLVGGAIGLGAVISGDLAIALFILVWFLASAGYYVFYEGF